MHIEVEHLTLYAYDAPVCLGPQTLRLRPRGGGPLRELAYALEIDPPPAWRTETLDAAGNGVVRVGFTGATRHLRLCSRLTVETGSPVDYAPRPAPAGPGLPIAYAPEEAALLAPYLAAVPPGSDPAVTALAERLGCSAAADPLAFLDLVNRWLHETIEREIRPDGAARSPAETLALRRGACRDQTVLFMALCRAQGFAARFVSGYQDRSALETARRYLHAWPEVYLPGAGWYGYDPTRGRPAADGHVPLAAAPRPAGTMPVEGGYWGSAGSRLEFDLVIRARSGPPGRRAG